MSAFNFHTVENWDIPVMCPSSTSIEHGPFPEGSSPRKRPRVMQQDLSFGESEQSASGPKEGANVTGGGEEDEEPKSETSKDIVPKVAVSSDDTCTRKEFPPQVGGDNGGATAFDIVSIDDGANIANPNAIVPDINIVPVYIANDAGANASLNDIVPANLANEADANAATPNDIVPDIDSVPGNGAKEAEVVNLLSDEEDDVGVSDNDVVEVIDVDSIEIVPCTQTGGPSSSRKRVVDLTHQPSPGLVFAVIRGLVNGESWSGVTNCLDCAYSAVRYAPPAASSYVSIVRGWKRLEDAMTIVREECDPARVAVHMQRSVVPELLDVLMYTDGCGLDEDSWTVKNVWAKLRPGSAKFWTGYGVWFAEDCPYNSCGVVPGEQNTNRAELYAVCKGLEIVVEHIDWAGRVLVRSDAPLQQAGEFSKRFAREPHKWPETENVDLWERVEKSMVSLEARGTIVIFEWVKAHAQSYGNMCADKLAKAGGLAGLSAGEPFDVEKGIQWGRYHPKKYKVPERFRPFTNQYAEIKRPVLWKDRNEIIQGWAQKKFGLTAEPCLSGEPHPKDAKKPWYNTC